MGDSGRFDYEKRLYKMVKEFQGEEAQYFNIDKLPYNDNFVKMMTVHIRQDLFLVCGQLHVLNRQLKIAGYVLIAILGVLIYAVLK